MNYNEKNSFNRTGNYKKKDRPAPFTLTLPITLRPSVNGGQDYTNESADYALTHLDEQILPYMNVPIIMSRAVLMDDEEKKGTVNVGFIKKYNSNDTTLEVKFFTKNVDRIKELNEDGLLSVAVNCIANDEKLSRFVSFELFVNE